MWRSNQPRRGTPAGTGWTLECWTDQPVAVPASARGAQRSPLVQFLQRLGHEDPLLQRWSTHCLEHMVHLMTLETPEREAVVQSAACLQALHIGIHKYRTGRIPRSYPLRAISRWSFDRLFRQPVFLAYPTIHGEAGVMVNHFTKGELYQVEMGTSLTYQIHTDRDIVWVAELPADGRVRIHDLPPTEFVQEIQLPPGQPGELDGCRRALRSLLYTLHR